MCTDHNREHQCGCKCKAPKDVTSSGTFCTFTGVETYGPSEVLYSNPASRDSFKRQRGGVHWTNELMKHRGKNKGDASCVVKSGRFKQHSPTKVAAALRRIFTSNEYRQYICKEQSRRKAFIRSELGHTAPNSLQKVVAVARRAAIKFPGARKVMIEIKDPRLDIIKESIIMYCRNNRNIVALSQIKNTAAFVAATLTLLSTGLAIKDKVAFPQIEWLEKTLPPPVAMTSIGIPCRSVSLAVRQLKKHVYGATFKGNTEHFFTTEFGIGDTINASR